MKTLKIKLKRKFLKNVKYMTIKKKEQFLLDILNIYLKKIYII